MLDIPKQLKQKYILLKWPAYSVKKYLILKKIQLERHRM